MLLKFLNFLNLAASLLLSSCVTARSTDVSLPWLKTVFTRMQSHCPLSARSGFSADIVLNNSASARVEAIWDERGWFSGQLINALGEDYLSFRIDDTGRLTASQTVDESDALFQALDLLAQIGPSETRLLLCSGLFHNQTGKLRQETKLSAQKQRQLQSTSRSLQLTSELLSPEANPKVIAVASEITTDGLIFKRAIASIRWQGQLTDTGISPTSLTVTSELATLKLLFHDFD